MVKILRNVCIMFLFSSPYAGAGNTQLSTIGWIEPVRILPESFELQAKIDTGADHSSLDITGLKNFERDGIEWVRFTIRNNNNDTRTVERPLERYAKIKRKQSDPLKRPVVQLWLCIGKDKFLVPVNLAQRENFKYRMLIGRSALEGRFLVDSAASMTVTPQCAPSP